MTDALQGFRAIAYNPVPGSENQIHGDDVAREHGFRGGLVPGVVVSAYLLDPALRAFGLDALGGSYAEVAVHKPLYDGDAFEVKLEAQDERGYRAALFDSQATRLAEARFELRSKPEVTPVFSSAPRAPRSADRQVASRELFSQLKMQGMGALRARFDAEHDMARYHATLEAQPDLVRAAPGGYANFAFLLGMTDWALARNVRLGPWLHLQTWSHHLAPVAYGSELTVESRVHDLFERKGHEFVDIDVEAFDAERRPVLAARMRAIYQLRRS
jgi:acyl dehydratase